MDNLIQIILIVVVAFLLLGCSCACTGMNKEKFGKGKKGKISKSGKRGKKGSKGEKGKRGKKGSKGKKGKTDKKGSKGKKVERCIKDIDCDPYSYCDEFGTCKPKALSFDRYDVSTSYSYRDGNGDLHPIYSHGNLSEEKICDPNFKTSCKNRFHTCIPMTPGETYGWYLDPNERTLGMSCDTDANCVDDHECNKGVCHVKIKNKKKPDNIKS